MKSSQTTDGIRDSFLHYILAGKRGRPLCRSEEDRSALCKSITGSIARSDASNPCGFQVLAYCVDDHWLRAVIESQHPELSRKLLKPALEDYRQGREEPLVSDAELWGIVHSVRLRSVADQLGAVRHCHFAPVDLGLVLDPVDWRWSSHRIYLGLEEMPGLARGTIANLLAGGQGGWPLAYAYLMSKAEIGDTSVSLPTVEVPILPRADTDGDRACIQRLKHSGGHDVDREFEAAVEEVCKTTGCGPRAFKADPSARRFRLERALLVERLTGPRKLMSIQGLAVRLACDRSWLYRTRKQCRQLYPDLFAKEDDLHPDGLCHRSRKTPRPRQGHRRSKSA